MLREFLDRLTELAERNFRPRVIDVPGEPGHVFYTGRSDGSLTKHFHTASPPSLSFSTMGSLAEAIFFIGTDGGSKLQPYAGSIWIEPQQIVYVFASQQRGRMRLEVPYSDQFKKLSGLAKPFHQKELISFLRCDMVGTTLDSADKLLDAARSMNWKKIEAGESEVSKGKVSLGRTIQTQVQNAANIPDEINFSVPIFANKYFTRTALIRVLVDLDVDTMQVRLVSVPGDIAEAEVQAQSYLRRELESCLTTAFVDFTPPPIYLGRFGTPSADYSDGDDSES